MLPSAAEYPYDHTESIGIKRAINPFYATGPFLHPEKT